MDQRVKNGAAVWAMQQGVRIDPSVVQELQARGLCSPDYRVATQQIEAAMPEAMRILAEQQAVAERQDSAEREVARWGASLSEANLRTIDAIHSQGGWPAVRAAITPYLSDAALTVLEHTYTASGGDLSVTQQAVLGRMARDAAEEQAVKAEAEAVGKWDPAKAKDEVTRRLLEGSHVAADARNPEVRAAARATYEQWAPKLGLAPLGPGDDPVRAVYDLVLNIGPDGSRLGEGARVLPHMQAMSGDDALKWFVEQVGEDEKTVREVLGLVHQRAAQHNLLSRLSAADRERAQVRSRRLEGKQVDEPPKRKEDGTRAAMERAAKAINFKAPGEDKPYEATSSRQVALAAASGTKFKPASREARATVERVTGHESSPEPDRSVRASLEHAAETLAANGDNDDAND